MAFDLILAAQGIFIWMVLLTVGLNKMPRMPRWLAVTGAIVTTLLGIFEVFLGMPTFYLLTAVAAGIAWGDLLHHYVQTRNQERAQKIVGNIHDDTN